ncbi:MAG: hypothetical protein K2R98_20670 [Gemmataceae bacterium]|nr:hypothetical protein [Gemmataceae bacterium]
MKLRFLFSFVRGLRARCLALIPHQAISQRALPLVFLAGATFLATACWLRPALSPDVRSYHIPLAIWSTTSPEPEEILIGPRRLVFDSIGVLLLALVAAGAVAILWRPVHVETVAGVLLCSALATNAAAALNHPALIELMDIEFEQRRQVASLIIKSPEKKAMANPHNGRIGGHGALTEDEQRGDVVRGGVYLLYGQWLILWAVLGIVFGGRGTLLRRGRQVLAWGLVGAALAGVFCHRRLHAELYWDQALDLEGEGDFAGASAALDHAVALFPELEQLERTWLLGGKIDYQLGEASLRERFFRAYQYHRDKGVPRAVAYAQDLPWTIKKTGDYRTGLTTGPAGFYFAEKPNSAETGTPYSQERLASLRMANIADHRLALSREHLRALRLMDELAAEVGDTQPAVRNQAARFWTDRGLQVYLDRPVLTDSDYNYFTYDRRLTTAQTAWQHAVNIVPGKRDCAFYLGVAQARINRDRPDLVAATLEPMLIGLADRPLRAEILDLLGDAYWEAGRMLEARSYFAQSHDTFSLPKRPNIRAQKKLGGL